MSKAFTRESESGSDEPVASSPAFSLPPGVKNYLTADGARRLKEELTRLVEVERPRAAGSTERRRELAVVDQRIAYLHQSLQAAEIVKQPIAPDGVVRFGATVTVRDNFGGTSKYRIVGIDEMDVDREWVSWRSPVARALLNKRLGEKVRFAVPEGERILEIVEIGYEGSE